VGANYQGGVLESDIRVTIQMIHRFGAVFTALYILNLGALLWFKSQSKSVTFLAVMLITLVITQFTLGIINALYLLPLGIAVAHNGVAALLMGLLFMLFYLTGGRDSHAADR